MRKLASDHRRVEVLDQRNTAAAHSSVNERDPPPAAMLVKCNCQGVTQTSGLIIQMIYGFVLLLLTALHWDFMSCCGRFKRLQIRRRCVTLKFPVQTYARICWRQDVLAQGNVTLYRDS